MTGDSTSVSALAKERRDARWRTEAADTLDALADCIGFMAQALREQDDIMGALSGEGIANHCAELPKHIRDVFMEHLSDEAASTDSGPPPSQP